MNEELTKMEIARFAVGVASHITKTYMGTEIYYSVNWRSKRGRISNNSASFGGKSLKAALARGSHFRATTHRMVPGLRDRHPLGIEALYWHALNLAAHTILIHEMKASGVKEVSALMKRFAFGFTLPAMMNLFDMKHVEASEDDGVEKLWLLEERAAYKKYVREMYQFLFEGFCLEDEERVKSMRFSSTRKRSAQIDDVDSTIYLIFGEADIQRRWQYGHNEYETVVDYIPQLNNYDPPKGIEAIYWIVCHEFAHILQSLSPNGGLTAKNGRGWGRARRDVHNHIFVSKYLEVIEAFPFEDSLELVGSAVVDLLS